MRRQLALAAASIGIAVAIAACGSSNGNDSSTTGTAAGTSGAAKGMHATVGTEQVAGVGSVLVGADGKALYTPDQEAGGMIRCTGGCTSIWVPVTPGAAKPTGTGDTGRLAVVKRPDGTRQVTAGGRPLYSFAEDQQGEVTGNGFGDAFGGQRFTWHVVLAGGAPSTSSAKSTSSSSSSSGGGSYGGGGY